MKTEADRQLRTTLKALGAVSYDLALPETKAMSSVIHPGEKILGVVYGRYKDDKDGTVSRGVLIATDQRVVLLNKKLLYKQNDEFAYRVISGVEYGRVWPMGTVSLHTRMGDIHVRTFNRKCAETFVAAIEPNLVQQ